MENTSTETKHTAGGVTNEATPLSDIFFATLRRWPWILLSLAVCIGLAVVYILRTPQVYTESAGILVKDDSKGKSVGIEDFADFGLFQSKSNIYNELTTLKSPDLMEEVVTRLKLDVNYFSRGRFHRNVAYGTDLPVTVSFGDIPDRSAVSFNLAVNAGGECRVTGLKIDCEDASRPDITSALGDTIAVDGVEMTVSRSPYYTDGEPVELMVSKVPLAKAVESYSGRLKVDMNEEKGTVLDLSFSDQSVQRADDVLNMLINVYNESWIHDKNQIAVSTSSFIDTRLAVIEAELGNVDSDISTFKSEHLTPDLQTASSMYMTRSENLAQQILALDIQLHMAQYIRSYLTAEGSRNQLLPANSGVDNAEIQTLIAEYNDRLLQRNSLVAKSSEKNPLVETLDAQLAAQRGAIIASVDNQITALNSQKRSLQGARASTTSKIASSPTQARYLLSVERQQKVKEALYLFLLQKREENEMSQAFTAYNTRIVNRPGPSGLPPTPNKRNILMVAFLLGLAIPFGVTYILETNNTRVRGRKDIEHLPMPFLGEIPAVPQGRKGRKGDKDSRDVRPLVIRQTGGDVVNEAFRVLRTNVQFMKGTSGGAEVVAVTSFNPGSGKSFITMNLAMTIALKGKRVLVIDGDMRHGSSSAYAGSPSRGLSNYLSDPRADISSDILKGFEVPSLDILPVGTVPPNPTELLETPRFAQLIDTLRPQYDYILIDCPPIEVVADAQIINAHVDRTFFIVRAGLLQRSMLPELERIYNGKKYRNLALILNGTDLAQSSYSYRYGYKYGYGYGNYYAK